MPGAQVDRRPAADRPPIRNDLLRIDAAVPCQVRVRRVYTFDAPLLRRIARRQGIAQVLVREHVGARVPRERLDEGQGQSEILRVRVTVE